jgi:hypothetical protein
MKLLLIIAAVIEAGAGLALLLIPTVAVSALLGIPLDTPTGLVAGRIAGAALVAITLRPRWCSCTPPFVWTCAVHCFGRRSFCICASACGASRISGLVAENYQDLKWRYEWFDKTWRPGEIKLMKLIPTDL